MRRLLFGLIGLTLAEIAIFVAVGRVVGVLPVLLAIVLSGLAGIALIRHQGRLAVQSLQAVMNNRAVLQPSGIGAGIMAGVLLIIPGFLTDLAALLVLVPQVRSLFTGLVSRQLGIKTTTATYRRGPATIDGEAHEVKFPAPPRLRRDDETLN